MMRVYTDYYPGVSENKNLEVEKFVLYKPAPNPFVRAIEIKFSIPKQSDIKFKIYDAAGRLVKTLIDGEINKGYHTVVWDGKDEDFRVVSSGIYFVKIDYQNEVYTEKVLFIK
jgi:hypothetical protein